MNKEIFYFDKPGRQNTDKMIPLAVKRAKNSKIHYFVTAWSSGYTTKKLLEIKRRSKYKMNIIVVTNTTGATMPLMINERDDAKTRKRKEEQLNRGITSVSISITDETRQELEKEGITVYFVPDYLNLEYSLDSREERNLRRSKLAQFGVPKNLRPLDVDVGVDLSLFTVISQGFRVCFGCTILSVKNGFVPEGELILAIGGEATALILQASSNPKTCLVKEIIGFERCSDRENQAK